MLVNGSQFERLRLMPPTQKNKEKETARYREREREKEREGETERQGDILRRRELIFG